jgi:release factor glutamine methyltransferase
VHDEDPLVFYKAITAFAKKNLTDRGTVYVEIHEDLEQSVKQLFIEQGFRKVEARKDLQGKNRMIKAGELIK